MGAALYFGAHWFAPYLASGSPLLVKATALALLCGGGMLLYFVLAFATGGADFGMIRRSVARRGGAAASLGDGSDPAP
jgi:putative peptidoglycan lipid II flippase